MMLQTCIENKISKHMHINVIKKDFISGGFMGNGVQGHYCSQSLLESFFASLKSLFKNILIYSMRHDFELYFNLCNCICISKGDHQTQN